MLLSDYGFKHSDGIVGPCIRDPVVALDDPCLTDNVLSYMKSTGYRKIPGDVCKNGVEDTFKKQSFSCCESSPAGQSTAALGALFGLTLFGALILIAVIVVLIV